MNRALDKLVYSGKASFVRHSNWATPVVFQHKKNGEVRVCLDGKVSINKQAVTDHYPLPRFDDIMVEMRGCDTFCKIDLEGAY